MHKNLLTLTIRRKMIFIFDLRTVQKLFVTRTPYKCSATKKKIAGIFGYVKLYNLPWIPS